MCGLSLVVDMSVNCFLASGDLPELMYKAAGYNNNNNYYYCYLFVYYYTFQIIMSITIIIIIIIEI